MARLSILAVVAGAGLWALACQDATEPFDPGPGSERFGGEVGRLTFSDADDRSPSWSLNGDSVLYTTEGSLPFPEVPGLLLRVPVAGGAAEPVLPDVQFPGGGLTTFTNPIPAPEGERVAWMELWSVRNSELCNRTRVVCVPDIGEDARQPRLDQLRLRVRRPASSTATAADPILPVVFEGLKLRPTPGGITAWVHEVEDLPFHREFDLEGVFVYRPSWSPDGDRIVYSDGLRLLIWDGLSGQAQPITGTADGVSPAWSPDGQWIAFSRLIRGARIESGCTHSDLGPACFQERAIYPVVDRIVTLVRPDGSELRELWRGGEPAWHSDAARVVSWDQDRLWIGDITQGVPQAIAGSDRAREPAVSPDGSLVAVSRLRTEAEGAVYDIWVLELPGAGQ